MATNHSSSSNQIQNQQWYDWGSPGQWARLQTKFFTEICHRHGVQFEIDSLPLPSQQVYSCFFQQQSIFRSLVEGVARTIPAGSSIHFSLEISNRNGVRNLSNDRLAFDNDYPGSQKDFIAVRLSVIHPIVDSYLSQQGRTFDLGRELASKLHQFDLSSEGLVFSTRTTGNRSKLALAIPCWTLDGWLNQALSDFSDSEFVSMKVRANKLQGDSYVTEMDRTIQFSTGAEMLIRVSNLDYWLVPDRDFDLRWIRQNLLMTSITSRTDLTTSQVEINCRQCGTVSALIERVKDEQAREGTFASQQQSSQQIVSSTHRDSTSKQRDDQLVSVAKDNTSGNVQSGKRRFDTAEPLLSQEHRIKFRVLRDLTRAGSRRKAA